MQIALKRAVAKHQERLGEPAPDGFRTLYEQICGTRSGGGSGTAGVALETCQPILGHKCASITTHYSAAS